MSLFSLVFVDLSYRGIPLRPTTTVKTIAAHLAFVNQKKARLGNGCNCRF
jgi:hypothetical protein